MAGDVDGSEAAFIEAAFRKRGSMYVDGSDAAFTNDRRTHLATQHLSSDAAFIKEAREGLRVEG